MIYRLLLSCLAVLVASSQTSAQSNSRANRSNLLLFRTASGSVRQITTPAEWNKRRQQILTGMQQVMGKYPIPNDRPGPSIRIVEEADAGRYIRRLITYQSEVSPDSSAENCHTPAYLCIPKDVLAGKRKAAAVLCLHPTDNTVGHKVVVGLGGRAGRQYAAELAERGYVTISPSYPHLANYYPNLGKAWLRQRHDESDSMTTRERSTCSKHSTTSTRQKASVRSVIRWVVTTRSTQPCSIKGSASSPVVADSILTLITTEEPSESGSLAKAGARFGTCLAFRITEAGLKRSPTTSTNSSLH